MAKKKALAFVIQSKQHLNKLIPIAEHFSDNYAIDLILEKDILISSSKLSSFNKFILNNYYRVDVHYEKQSKFGHFLGTTFTNFNLYLLAQFKNIVRSVFPTSVIIRVKKLIAKKNNPSKSYIQAAIHKTQCVKNFVESRQKSYQALFLAEANVELLTEIYLKFIPYKYSIIIPHVICSPLEPAIFYSSNKLYHSKEQYQKLLRSEWFFNYKDLKLIRLPFESSKYLEKMGLSPPLPWIQESSSATYICAESSEVENYYISNGIAKQQIATIGDHFFTEIYYCLKNRELNRNSLNVSSESKVILFAVFPDCSNTRSAGDHKDYKSSIKEIIKELIKFPNSKLILHFHPTLDPRKFAFLKKLGDVTFVTGSFAEAISLADLYVANISSTIKWAIALGIPVINYDVYKYDYDDFDHVKGVLYCNSFTNFKKHLEYLSYPKNFDRIQLIQTEVSRRWGIIDDNFFSRLNNIIS